MLRLGSTVLTKRGSPTKSIALSLNIATISFKTFAKAYTSDLISDLLAKGQACMSYVFIMVY